MQTKQENNRKKLCFVLSNSGPDQGFLQKNNNISFHSKSICIFEDIWSGRQSFPFTVVVMPGLFWKSMKVLMAPILFQMTASLPDNSAPHPTPHPPTFIVHLVQDFYRPSCVALPTLWPELYLRGNTDLWSLIQWTIYAKAVKNRFFFHRKNERQRRTFFLDYIIILFRLFTALGILILSILSFWQTYRTAFYPEV